MIDMDIPKDLPVDEYTLRWKKKNLARLQNVISEMKHILSNPRKYKTYNALLLGNFIDNLTITAEAIFILSLKYFEAEIITLAGTMIEGMSLMLYCLKNNKAESYIDYLTINGLLLEYRQAEIGSPSPPQIEHYVNLLERLENRYTKSGKNYIDIINCLRSKSESYSDKFKVLQESYKVFPKRAVKSMVDEFMETKVEKSVYEQYCHIKHYHLNNTYVYPELQGWKKEFSPFDELCAISTAVIILEKIVKIYKKMKESGDIVERY